MIAGIWTHRDVVEDVFSFEDLLDAHELLDVREANAAIAHDWQQQQRALLK